MDWECRLKKRKKVVVAFAPKLNCEWWEEKREVGHNDRKLILKAEREMISAENQRMYRQLILDVGWWVPILQYPREPLLPTTFWLAFKDVSLWVKVISFFSCILYPFFILSSCPLIVSVVGRRCRSPYGFIEWIDCILPCRAPRYWYKGEVQVGKEYNKTSRR